MDYLLYRDDIKYKHADGLYGTLLKNKYGVKSACVSDNALLDSIRYNILSWREQQEIDEVLFVAFTYDTSYPTSLSCTQHSTCSTCPNDISINVDANVTSPDNLIEVNVDGCITKINVQPTINIEGGGAGSNYVGNGSIWTITHNLGYPPNIYIVGTGAFSGMVLEGSIVHTTTGTPPNLVCNVSTISFGGTSVTGIAYLS